MNRPLLDYLLSQLEGDFAKALEQEIYAAVRARLGHALPWSALDHRAVTYMAGPGVYEVVLDERPLLRIEHTYGITRSNEEAGVTLAVAPLRIVLLP